MPPEEFDFDAGYGGERIAGPSRPSVPEAHALIDQAISQLGLDPREATDANGWRHLQSKAAHVMVNIVELHPGLNCLVVWSPIMTAPEDRRLRTELLEELLRRNHAIPGAARFSLHADDIEVSLVRPIHGLDLAGVGGGIQATAMFADWAVFLLRPQFDLAMPKIEMSDESWQTVLEIWRTAPAHTQQVFSYLVEQWVLRNGAFSTGKGSLALEGRQSKGQTLAALRGGLVVIGWESLQRTLGLLPEDLKAFQEAVPRTEGFEITKHSAHLPVREDFSTKTADQLLDALQLLDDALARAVPPTKEPLPDLKAMYGLQVKAGAATQRNIGAVLETCPGSTRTAFLRLVQGWDDAGGDVYTNKPTRISLRMTVGKHRFALCSLVAPTKSAQAHIELQYPLTMYFEKRLSARRTYEEQVVRVPGFSVHGTMGRIEADDGLTDEHVAQLLRVLLRLKEDVAG